MINDITIDENSVLILPGADTWNDPVHAEIIKKASELLDAGALVCAICGATTALANYGLLDNRMHTSNGVGFLDMFCRDYKGKDYYVDEPSVVDNNLITAACTGALMWTKQIIEKMGVFQADALEAWYNYFSTGKVEYFYALMQSKNVK